MDMAQKMGFFKEQLMCGDVIYSWCYDESSQLLSSNCPEESVIATAFSLFGCKDRMYEYAKEETAPVIISTPVGLIWAAAFEKEKGTLKRAYLIGPVLTTDVSLAAVEKSIKHFDNFDVSLAWKSEFVQTMPKLPVVLQVIFNRYALMLQYCVTGEQLGNSDIKYISQGEAVVPKGARKIRDRHRTWMAEQALLRMVREGDLNFKNAMDKAFSISGGVPVDVQDPIRQAKISGIVFTSLCTRAAIEGGLLPEQAYSLGDTYIQGIESSKTLSEAASFNHTMYVDFIHQVHKCRINPNISKQIRDCCDYIEMHVENNIGTDELAKRIGYSPYYLTRKFKKEMKISVNDYIKIAKIERAKLMLSTSDASVQEVADKLGFCSRSYFGEVFRDIVNCSPVEYKRKPF